LRPMRFQGVLELHGKTATGFAVPPEVVADLGSQKRPPVRVTVGGYTYRTTMAPMGGRFLIPVSAENRAAAGLTAGDEVTVEIEFDTETREIAMPADLAAALEPYPDARAYFDGLATSHRKEWVRWIEESKKVETRQARVAKAVEGLRAGNPRH
jgi:hypothetical protein